MLNFFKVTIFLSLIILLSGFYSHEYHGIDSLAIKVTELKLSQKIPTDKAKTFMNHTYKIYRLEQSVLLYRVGNSKYAIGEYYTFFEPAGEMSSRIERAMPPIWPGEKQKNIIDTAYWVRIPKGTIMYVGMTAPQGRVFVGGTEQVYIPNARALKNLQVVKKYALLKEPLINLAPQ